jgi:hypothetical protein
MVCLQTKNSSIQVLFGILYGHLKYFMALHMVYLVVIWYIFPTIGMLYQEKSGKPVCTVTISNWNFRTIVAEQKL